jgi:nicotinate-nucleotide pyrophosphorylase (carboxylating)
MYDQKKSLDLIKSSLKEDIGKGDITTSAIINNSDLGSAQIIVKQNGIIAGVDIVKTVFKLADSGLILDAFAEDGDNIFENMQVFRLSGNISSILRAERTALNFLAHLSGIATLTAKFVERVRDSGAKITDTRKTTPMLRTLEKYAVKCGGGVNHRMGLFDMILIKENHIRAAGGIGEAVSRVRKYLANNLINTIIEVETANLADVQEAVESKADRIMLDNMDLNTMRQAVDYIDGRAEVEASGGISLDTVAAVAQTGVDFISVGALTHSAPVLDFSLLL